MRTRGVAASSINTYLRCIAVFWKWQGRDWKVPRLKEEQKILATLGAEQVERITRWKPTGRNLTREHAACLIILDTGLRITECLNISRPDLDFENFVIRVRGKGNKHRQVPMSIELRKVLFRYCSQHTHLLVFSTRSRTRTTTRNFQRDMGEMGERLGVAGVRFSPHTLRHTMAVSYLRHGGDNLDSSFT